MCLFFRQLGLRTSFLSWSLRNLSKSVGPFFREWKTSAAKSTGFRIQLLSTENRTGTKRMRPNFRQLVLFDQRIIATFFHVSLETEFNAVRVTN